MEFYKFGKGFINIIIMYVFGFFYMCWRSIRSRLWKIWFFLCLVLFGGDRVMNLIIKIFFIKEIIYIENGDIWLCNF